MIVYYPQAVQLLIQGKTWGDHNKLGVICHSAEGYWACMEQILQDSNSRKSWHFSIVKDGTVYQHYNILDSPWHAGHQIANQDLVGIEHEGRVGEPLTTPQLESSIELVKWLSEQLGFSLVRGHGLYEHNEFTNTACPSGRIPWDRYEYVPPIAPLLETNTTYLGYDAGVNRFKWKINVHIQP